MKYFEIFDHPRKNASKTDFRVSPKLDSEIKTRISSTKKYLKLFWFYEKSSNNFKNFHRQKTRRKLIEIVLLYESLVFQTKISGTKYYLL